MPKLPVVISSIPDGLQRATITGVEVKQSSKQNPMIKVELALESGQLIDDYLVILAQGAAALPMLLRACGYHNEAEQLMRHKVPDFELDNLEGREVRVDMRFDRVKSYYPLPRSLHA